MGPYLRLSHGPAGVCEEIVVTVWIRQQPLSFTDINNRGQRGECIRKTRGCNNGEILVSKSALSMRG